MDTVIKFIKKLLGIRDDYSEYTEQAKRDGWDVDRDKLRRSASPLYTPHPALVDKDKVNGKVVKK